MNPFKKLFELNFRVICSIGKRRKVKVERYRLCYYERGKLDSKKCGRWQTNKAEVKAWVDFYNRQRDESNVYYMEKEAKS